MGIVIAFMFVAIISFVAGAELGKSLATKTIAFEIRVLASYHAEVAGLMGTIRDRVRSLRAHL